MLQTEIYLDYLTGKLTQFAQITRSKSAMNLNDSAISAESLYREFFNELFGWHLISTNSYSSNAAGIDLVDTNDAVMVQITAQSGRQKIVHTLDEVDTNKYKDYHLLIMFITKPANNTRRQKYVIPDHIEFDPKHDILDVDSVLRLCQTASLVTLSRLDALCRNMFNDEQPKLQQVSSVSKVVQAIYVSPLDKLSDDQIPLAFDVQKKVDFNKLEPIQASLIDPLKLYYGVMLSIYDTFNSEGHFTLTLFQTIASVYEKVNVPYSGLSSAEIFLRMIDELVSIVNRSSNIDDSISQEDRILSCRMIMVHAFMDCKIFEDPEGYYAVAN